MLLYIHFPFCRSKCIYCNFYSVKLNNELLELYLQGILREIEYWGKNLPKKLFKSIYIGGGTPSLLTLHQLEKILNGLFKNFQFDEHMEFSFEGNPDSLKDLVYLKGLKKILV